MIDLLPEFLLTEPRRLIALGRFLLRSGAFILLVGSIGHAATTASAAAMSIGKQAAVSPTLAQLYPALPTWWVPESILGCLPAIILLIIGLSMASLGKRLKNAYF
ncbi:hypothetical protein J2W39_000057 [Variovorax paradoxus]|uniref:Uncharacterized protein n=1 Tax=Variovorax paradoxus TaxID=34073 RepID=A0AAW8E8E6_VARPD|nr:hypothetical protein [Variovorax paradoxus]MDP9968834.1 hypothetical protein [Variovorax paradoxus]